MTVDDWHRLALYKAKRGPLNPAMRVQSSLADIAALICAAAGIKKQGGGQFSPADFMPWADDDGSNDPMSLTSIAKKLGVKA